MRSEPHSMHARARTLLVIEMSHGDGFRVRLTDWGRIDARLSARTLRVAAMLVTPIVKRMDCKLPRNEGGDIQRHEFAARSLDMRRILILAGLSILSAMTATTLTTSISTPAEAAVCARGVRGAACAGPRGAVAVRRPVVAPVHRGAVVVAPVRRRAVIVR
jgi:hypothetical protein